MEGAYLKPKKIPAVYDWMSTEEMIVSSDVRRRATTWIIHNFGEKCQDFDPNCECCRRWLALENLFGDIK